MMRSTKQPARKAAALLALAALFTYGPTTAAFAEPASPGEAREASRAPAAENGGRGATLPGPNREARRGAEAPREKVAPPSKKLHLSVPRLGLKNIRVGDSPDQSFLDRHGIMHLSDTGFPYQKNSNTYIAAHAIGYADSRVQYAFQDLETLKKGDKVYVRDASGKTYTYRVYEKMIVDPDDYWVTRPVEGKKIVSLQTCWPEPSFEKRLIVRAEIVRK